MFTNILKSVTNNINTRIKNPIIGALVTSWIIFNWAKLTLLFWGEGNLKERIQTFNKAIDDSSLIIYLVPLLITVVYLFALPVINLLVQRVMKSINIKIHEFAVEVDLEKQTSRSELNKENFKANPDNGFIKKELDLEFSKKEIEKNILEASLKEQEEKKQTSEAVRIKAEEELKIEEIKREKDDLELERYKRYGTREQEKRELDSTRRQTEIANARLPLLLDLTYKLSTSFWEKEIKISFQDIIRIICTIFDYSSKEDLLNDSSFNLDAFASIKYLIYDSREVAIKLGGILDSGKTGNIKSDHLLQCIGAELEAYEIKFIDEKLLPENIHAEIKARGGIILDEGLSGVLARTSDYFEEDPELNIGSGGYQNNQSEYQVSLYGSCQGSQLEDKTYLGDTLKLSVIAHLTVILGINALSSYELEVNGSIINPKSEE